MPASIVFMSLNSLHDPLGYHIFVSDDYLQIAPWGLIDEVTDTFIKQIDKRVLTQIPFRMKLWNFCEELSWG